jgi:phage tail protein X
MPKSYTTKQGDSWDAIALSQVGDESAMNNLIEANPNHRETVLFSAGVVLVIPDVSVVTTSTTLPPWKR